jgi:hypothetical protein
LQLTATGEPVVPSLRSAALEASLLCLIQLNNEMNSIPDKKPRFYFSSQRAARQTIFWLFVIFAALLLVAYANYRAYEKNGYITISDKSGSFEIHGPDAMTTIYFYTACSLITLGIGSYFLVMYIRIRNAQKKSSEIIIPEIEIAEKITCPSCLKEKPKYFSSKLCAKCTIEKESMRPDSNSKKIYDFLYPDFDELTVFLIGFVLCLLIFFNPECQEDVLKLFESNNDDMLFIVMIGATLIILVGVLISFIHILIVSKKDSFSENGMKAFALIVLSYVGFKGGIYALENQNYLYIISPGWNLIMAAICYTGLGMIDEVPFDQTDSKYLQTFLSLVLVSIIFYFLNFVLELYWPITFSFCINYVVCINRGTVNSKFLKLNSIDR